MLTKTHFSKLRDDKRVKYSKNWSGTREPLGGEAGYRGCGYRLGKIQQKK